MQHRISAGLFAQTQCRQFSKGHSIDWAGMNKGTALRGILFGAIAVAFLSLPLIVNSGSQNGGASSQPSSTAVSHEDADRASSNGTSVSDGEPGQPVSIMALPSVSFALESQAAVDRDREVADAALAAYLKAKYNLEPDDFQTLSNEPEDGFLLEDFEAFDVESLTQDAIGERVRP